MNEYLSNIDLRSIAEKIRDADTVLITTHSKPDGDAIGSVIALAGAIQALDKQLSLWLIPPVADNLSFLFDEFEVNVLSEDNAPVEPRDLHLVLDTGAWGQVAELKPFIEKYTDRTIVIDHHQSGDADMSAWRYVDKSAPAAAMIIAKLIGILGPPWTPAVAQALYTGIATDTGWFKYSNATPESMRLCADLIEAGANHTVIYENLEQQERPEKYRLLQRVLASFELIGDGEIVLMGLSETDFTETGTSISDTEGFVNMGLAMKGVSMAAFFVQVEANKTKISLRSKPGEDAIDVSALANLIGGGGHKRAAGCRCAAPLTGAIEQFKDIVATNLESLKTG